MNEEPDIPEGDSLDVLTTLVEAYEACIFPMPPVDPAERISLAVEQENGLLHP